MLENVTQKIKHVFDWTPIYVNKPVKQIFVYRDVGERMLGYSVSVRYKYHGVKSYLFPLDDDKLDLVSKERALRRATEFYRECVLKILARNENTK